MFVMQAKFEIEKEHEERLERKAQNNKREIENAEGLLSYECWRRELKETVEYAFVSKWETQNHFKAWISREEHVNQHKAANAQRKEGIIDPVKMKKTLHSYEVLNEGLQIQA
ncbi:heme-degrading monooxygenase HmoA [Pullulanibacillus pueri]|uniref:ABM domain-containing protein n=1 Tax=Pullulanibacillus pueri TaxID=1437324 RepID=A0A8J2ZSN3_9BACL|nr:antibiotic biosynthesis monooxygenase [Pullulanibacillus pueri]MBM7680450.1 heme-degrading monooxygenase HmoA [Pullulanibacillus pueri]GGH75027.1 hypothetical protein GCM10007096_03820 [Pullulanibacillus pueri]